VSVEVAQLLKMNGFDWPCEFYYEWYESGVSMFKGFINNWRFDGKKANHNKGNSLNKFSRPTVSYAMQWLRVVHNLFVKVDYTTHPVNKENNYYGTVVNMKDPNETVLKFEEAMTYEGCANKLIRDALNNMEKYYSELNLKQNVSM
jgi:hypothetical protein